MTTPPIARARVLRAYDHGETTTVLGDEGERRTFSGDSAGLVRAILRAVVTPRTRDELLARLAELAGEPVPWTGAVADAIAHLEAAGALRSEPAPAPPRRARRRVLLGLTGGVAASFAPALVQLLQARGLEVRVAATKSALRFVGGLALEALTHAPVVASLWPPRGGDRSEPVPHLALARWADLVVVYPASATSIARLAAGSCGTVVSAAAIATRAPVLVVPSMNEAMVTAPAVERNLEQLRQDGFFLAHPSLGLEVADAPERRGPMLGAAPPVAAVADLVDAILEHAPPREVAVTDWDRVYRTTPAAELPWSTETLDRDFATALDAIPPGGRRLLDLGTGTGTAAIAASDRGFSVVATDVAPHAIALAVRRAGARPITWLVDDVLATRLRGSFDVVLDRGLCHVLPRASHAAYAAAVTDLVRPGGHLVLKCHAAGEGRDRGTVRFTHGDLVELFGAAFEPVRIEDAIFPGPSRTLDDEVQGALFAVLRRRESL